MVRVLVGQDDGVDIGQVDVPLEVGQRAGAEVDQTVVVAVRTR